MSDSGKVLGVLTALADPLRLAVLRQLMGGPAAVSELVAVTGATQSNISNHLALLRERRLVRALKVGRQRVYELQDSRVAELVESLNSVAGGVPAPVVKDAALIRARTCYDHLAGKLGVRLFDALTERDAIALADGPAAHRAGSAGAAVHLGPAADEVFGKLGVELDGSSKRRAGTRRAPGFACQDWTEHRPHLGGGLGRALWSRFVEQGWIARKPGTRAVLITPAGRSNFQRRLDISIA